MPSTPIATQDRAAPAETTGKLWMSVISPALPWSRLATGGLLSHVDAMRMAAAAVLCVAGAIVASLEPLLGLVIAPIPVLLLLLDSGALFSSAAIPFLLALPLGTLIGPAPAQIVALVYCGICLLLRPTAFPLPLRLRWSLGLAGAALTAALFVGLLRDNTSYYVIGDAAQIAGLYVAVIVAYRCRVDLLGTSTLVLLGLAVLITTLVNQTMVSDMVTGASGELLQRNINFLAPVTLVYATARLLWGPRDLVGTLLLAVSMIAVFISFSLGMWAGTLIAMVTLLVLYLSSRIGRAKWRGVLAVLFVTSLAVSLFSLWYPAGRAAVLHRLSSVLALEEQPDWQRRQLESRLAREEISEPLLGEGLGATYYGPSGIGTPVFGERHFIHNQYLMLLLRMGIVGSALVAASLWLTRPSPLRNRRGAAATATAAYALVTSVSSPLVFLYPLNLVIGLSLGDAMKRPEEGSVSAPAAGTGPQATAVRSDGR